VKLSVSLQLLDLGQSEGLLGRVISSSQGLCLYTNTTQTLNIHAQSGIRSHGPGARASEDSLCLRLLGYRDRHVFLQSVKIAQLLFEILKYVFGVMPSFLSSTCVIHYIFDIIFFCNAYICFPRRNKLTVFLICVCILL
jgi:hypothetical protein